MRFFEIVVAGAALVSGALAQLAINDFPSGGVVAGQTYTITYSPKDQTPTQIILRQGASGNLATIATLGTATGGSFTWTVDKTLPNQPNYALEVKRGDTSNYSGQFGLTGGSTAAVSSAVASASAALSSASAALSSIQASASSVASSLASKITSAASASATMSSGSNSTIASATLSRTASASGSGSGSATRSAGPPQASNNVAAGVKVGSGLALGAVAALLL